MFVSPRYCLCRLYLDLVFVFSFVLSLNMFERFHSAMYPISDIVETYLIESTPYLFYKSTQYFRRTDEGVDVTDEEAVRKAIKRVKSDGGAIDVVINNAGYFMEGCEKVSDDSLDVSRT